MNTPVSPSLLRAQHSRLGDKHGERRDDAARVMARLEALAACSDDEENLTRLFASPALQAAHELVGGWMREAGMQTRVDAIGNLWGRVGPEGTPAFWLGSHLDTVPDAGKYDGALGVVMALEVVADMVALRKRRGQALPFALEIVGFSDEEGVRYGARCLGSRAVAGTFEDRVLDLRDDDEVSMRAALRAFGQSGGWQEAQAVPESVLGYLEAHIEQGPVLEDERLPLAVVSSIAGQTRLRARFAGRAGHAGTQPMALRRDALCAASEWILEVEDMARATEDLVATVGTIEAQPNASNVVPGEVVCTLDARHPNDDAREEAVGELLSSARRIAARRGVSFDIVFHNRQQAVPMDADLSARLQRAVENVGISAPAMVSGAGHDAAILAPLCPVSVLFLRTPGGLSHNPAESVDEGDVALGLSAMRAFLDGLLEAPL